MQTIKSSVTTWLAIAVLSLALAAQAGNVFKADDANNLNDPAAWVGGATPTAADVAVWDNTVQINNTSLLGADTNWAGIQILDPALPITISAGNTLTLGAAGIDMSLATNGLTLACPMVLGANQTWNVTNGLTLTISSALGVSTATNLTLNGNGTVSFNSTVNGTYAGNITVNGGVLVINSANANNNSAVGTGIITNNGGTLRFNSGHIVGNVLVFNGNCTVDAAGKSTAVDGAWSGAGSVLISNLNSSGLTLTAGGNGNGGGNMNNFTGSITIADTNSDGTSAAGSLRFNNGGGNNNLGNAAMTLNLGGPNSTVQFTEKNAGTTATFGALSGGSNTALAKGENYAIGALNLDTTFAGTILSGSTLTKNGTGTFTLTGNNPYTGSTTINGGVLQIGDAVTTGAGSLGTGAVVINTSGTLLFDKPDDFAMNNNISGAGPMIKTNTSNLNYGGTDLASGTLLVSQGTLSLGGAGVISAPITLADGTLYDVTGNPAYTLNSTLSGFGAMVGLLTAGGGTINPGGTGAAGTLTFSNGLSELGGVNHQFELSSPGSTNDLISVIGDLNLTGFNNITLSQFGGGSVALGTYPLINYSGNFIGALNNLSVTVAGVTGTLTNPPNQIAIIITPASRPATNLTWVGDGAANNWDTTSSNWVNGATSFSFLAGDGVTFDDAGLVNSNVTVAASVLPASLVVNSTGHYTLTGNFAISGTTGLTKTNSGTLSIYGTNNYTGVTVVGGGTLEAFNLANGRSASAIGAASSNPSNLVFYGSVFKYSGDPASTDRGATLKGTGVTIDVASGTSLTENGILTGTGALTVIDSGTLSLGVANSYTGGTIISNGFLATTTDMANTSGFGPTNSPITFYGGTLALYRNNGDDGSTTFSFYNPLVVPAGQTVSLNVFQRGNVYGPLTGGGVINITASGQRSGFAGNWSAFTGTINITGNFRVGNPVGYSNAVINLNDGADLDGGNASGTYSSNPIFDIGELDGTSLATLGGAAVTKPSPNPTWRVGWKNTTSTFAGTIGNPAGGASAITKVGAGAWILSGQNIYSGSTIISNGVLALATGSNGDGSIGSSTNIFINAGAFLDVSGRSDVTLPLGSGQVLAGNGTVLGLLDTVSGGTVSPGGGITGATGTLTVTNGVSLNGGTAWMKLNRAGSPTSDKLAAPGITLGGTLMVTNIGAPLQTGDTFTLFSGALSGAFGTLILPGYYTWDTSQLSVNGSIKVTSLLPPPKISSVDSSQLASGYLTLNAVNGAPNGPVNVLTTTNLTRSLSSWTTATSTAFDATGNLSVQVTVDPTLPQSYFLLQGQ